MKMETVPFITCEDDSHDLIVSFPLGMNAARSITLIRTPKYETLLDDDERGVSVGTGKSKGLTRELLVAVHWRKGTVEITTTGGSYMLSIGKVSNKELSFAKKLLKRMNFDSRFTITDASCERAFIDAGHSHD